MCCAAETRSLSQLAELLGERNSPELLHLETKFASLASYGLTVRLMADGRTATARPTDRRRA